MMHHAQLTALVTGANRGIGFEACRRLSRAGMRIIVTSRNAVAGLKAFEELRNEGLHGAYQQLDIASAESVSVCYTTLQEKGIVVDVLINNAGIYVADPILNVDEEVFWDTLQVNLLGAWRMSRVFIPDMLERGYGRVVNVSSGMGQITQSGGPQGGAYGLSKTALNALTCELAEAASGDVKVNAMCPGWVATRMGGGSAPRTPEQVVETLLWLATLPADGPSGGFFRDKEVIPW